VKKVLFIAPNFPPTGGIGVQRSIALVKGLSARGYEPIVLTVSLEDIKRIKAKWDEEPLKELETLNIQIHRVHSGQPYRLIERMISWRLYRVLWTLAYPWFWERFSFWPKHALSKALELIKEEGIELIYSSSAPYTAMELASHVKKRTGIKWVNDIRDPWTEHFGWVWPTKLHWFWSRWKERKMMADSDEIVVVSPEMKRYYLERSLCSKEHIHVITNGY
jgi:glycosyltransferase involved in cell wall biosynthesis